MNTFLVTKMLGTQISFVVKMVCERTVPYKLSKNDGKLFPPIPQEVERLIKSFLPVESIANKLSLAAIILSRVDDGDHIWNFANDLLRYKSKQVVFSLVSVETIVRWEFLKKYRLDHLHHTKNRIKQTGLLS